VRQDIVFSSGHEKCAGWFYLPDEVAGGAGSPVIIMAHGFSGVKEQGLDPIADRFSASGFAVVVFDFRCFGASGGEPRGQLFPHDMVEDYRNAITWACQQPQVNPERVGLWGTSFSGGLATHAATVDKRVRAVVAQVPSLWNAGWRRAVDPERWDAIGKILIADRISRYETGITKMMPVVAPEGEPCILPGQESFDFFKATRLVTPNWRNEITIESLEKMREFDPVSLIQMLAPAALLVIAAKTDKLVPLAAVEATFAKAFEPKRMVVEPIGHFDVYQEPWRSRSAEEAVSWYRTHLR
jgi:pimeloyl-ACP methyl ester carboxylesterase